MPIGTTNAISGPYYGNGVATAFPFTFEVLSADQVQAQVDGYLASTGSYSVSLSGSAPSTGTITFNTPPENGAEIYAILNPSFAQEIEFSDGAPYLAGAVNDGYDQAVLRDQVLARDLRHTIRFPMGEQIPPLPPASSRALNYLAFDADGNPVAIPGAQTINLNGDGFSLGAEAMGATANDGTKAVANVAAIRVALAVLNARGGGVLQFGAGAFTLDAAALGVNGIAIPGGVRVRGIGAMTILQSTDLSFTGNPVFSATGGVVWVEDLKLRGRAVFSNLTGGGMRRARIEGSLNETQYLRVAANFTAAFAAPTFNDGAGGVPAADYTWALVGNVGTMTLDATVGLLGTATYYRYAQSAAVALDPTKRYVVRFNDGFFTGAGAAEPQITLYDGAGNPVDAKQSLKPYVGAPVNNLHKPQNNAMYVGTGAGGADEAGAWQVAYITGASQLKLAVGGYRGYGTTPGLAASFDFSKVEILQLVNDFAGFDLNNLPTNAVQVQFSNCSNVEMSDCTGYAVAGRVGLMLNCTASTMRDNKALFCTHGYHFDGCDLYENHDNVVDQRFRADDGTLRGMRAYRWKGIGGAHAGRCRVYDNVIIGASWAVEILPYDTTKSCWVYNNVVWAEFAGYSLGSGRFFVRGNRAHLSSDGLFGFELPGSTDPTQFIHANADANFVEWSDFSGYNGFGYSCSTYRDIKVKGGFIRAPWLIQGVNGQTGATILIDDVDGEFGTGAYLGRNGAASDSNSVTLNLGKVKPMKPMFGYGSGVSDAIIDISLTNGSGHTVSVNAAQIDVGAGRYVQMAGVGTATISLKEVRNPGGYRTGLPIFIAPPAAEAFNLRLIANDFAKPLSSMTSTGWCQISGAVYAGSSILMRGNKWANEGAPAPTGTYSRAILRGDPFMVAYKAGQAIGTLAAGQTFDIAVAIPGLAVVDQAFDLESYTNGGLDGLAWACWATADDTATLRLRNITGASTNFGTQTLRVTARRTA